MYTQSLTRLLLGISFILTGSTGECESCTSEARFLSMPCGGVIACTEAAQGALTKA